MELAGEGGGAPGRQKPLKENAKQEVAQDCAITQCFAKLESL